MYFLPGFALIVFGCKPSGVTITEFNSRIIGKDGVNGSAAFVEVSTGKLSIQVSDRNNVNNSWSAVVYLHETLTNVTIS